jgi:GrpB-like predicted nucleotidyltransferase (UPF0157 family)
MITPEQEEWLGTLSAEKTIRIVPYDPACVGEFENIKEKIQAKMPEVEALHCGASGMGISGQDEIDVYVPVLEKDFNAYIPRLTELFGEPGSLYPLKRARFRAESDKKRIEIFLINKESADWQNSLRFEAYLKSHPDALKEYEKFKEAGNGLSMRAYYRRKIEFLSEILARI